MSYIALLLPEVIDIMNRQHIMLIDSMKMCIIH